MSGSGYKSFSAGSVLTASDVNGYLMKQSIMYFSSTSTRDSTITVPEDGMVCYINSNDSSEGLYTYNGSAWRKGPGWNAPWGVLGYQSTNTPFSTSSDHTVYQDAGLSATVSVVANRLLRITWNGHFYAPGGANNVFGKILRGSTAISEYQTTVGEIATALTTSVCLQALYAPTATASETFKVQIRAQQANTQVSDYADAAIQRSFIVEDIGPSGAPA